jgi:methyl-accepting chemotaxis protein
MTDQIQVNMPVVMSAVSQIQSNIAQVNAAMEEQVSLVKSVSADNIGSSMDRVNEFTNNSFQVVGGCNEIGQKATQCASEAATEMQRIDATSL